VEQTLIPFVPSALAGPVLLPRPILSPFHATKQFLLALTSSLRHAHPVFTVVHCSPFALLAITYTTRLSIVPIIVVDSRRITIFATQLPLLQRKHHNTFVLSSLNRPRPYTFATPIVSSRPRLRIRWLVIAVGLVSITLSPLRQGASHQDFHFTLGPEQSKSNHNAARTGAERETRAPLAAFSAA